MKTASKKTAKAGNGGTVHVGQHLSNGIVGGKVTKLDAEHATIRLDGSTQTVVVALADIATHDEGKKFAGHTNPDVAEALDDDQDAML